MHFFVYFVDEETGTQFQDPFPAHLGRDFHMAQVFSDVILMPLHTAVVKGLDNCPPPTPVERSTC